jgi:hypothetical protein
MTLKKRFFLASSADLARERDLAELLILRRNPKVVEAGLSFEVVRWEFLLQTISNGRVQDRFSEEMLTCDVMVVLFYAKVGKFTKEEFDIAYASLRASRNPRHILAYFKTKPSLSIDKIDKDIRGILKLRKEIAKHEGIYVDFDSRASLELSLERQLDLLTDVFVTTAPYFVIPEPDITSEVGNMPKDKSLALRVLKREEVRVLAKTVGLFQEWKVNPHLTFQEGDILYFWERKFPRIRLEAQFRARKLVLQKADENGIFLPEPGDLSEKAKPIEGRILMAWQATHD